MLKLEELLKPAIDGSAAPEPRRPAQKRPAAQNAGRKNAAKADPPKPTPTPTSTAEAAGAAPHHAPAPAPTADTGKPGGWGRRPRTDAGGPEAASRPRAMFNPGIAAAAENEARRAHAGQTDKAGRPYEEHLGRVAAAFTDPGDVAVAWLHDTLEDTGLTAAELVHRGIPQALVDDVEMLTRQGVEKYGGYIERVGTDGSPRAVAVKTADIRDHLDVNPKAITDDHRRRYRHALKRLRQHAKRRRLPISI